MMRGVNGASDPLPHNLCNKTRYSSKLITDHVPSRVVENSRRFVDDWDAEVYETCQMKKKNYQSSPIKELEEELLAGEQKGKTREETTNEDENIDENGDGNQIFHNMLNLLSIKRMHNYSLQNKDSSKSEEKFMKENYKPQYTLMTCINTKETVDDSCQINSSIGFPSYFNPRVASNMSHKEKVNKWLENIPYANLNNNDFYYLHKNNGIYNIGLYSLNWEEDSFENNYKNLNLLRNEDLIQYQAEKIDTLIRKSYYNEVEKSNDIKDCSNITTASHSNLTSF